MLPFKILIIINKKVLHHKPFTCLFCHLQRSLIVHIVTIGKELKQLWSCAKNPLDGVLLFVPPLGGTNSHNLCFSCDIFSWISCAVKQTAPSVKSFCWVLYGIKVIPKDP